MAPIVIVGGGHAAGQAAASIRQAKYEGELIMLTDEAYVPYHRPPLSKKYLSGDEQLEHLYLRKPDFYEKKNIDLRTGTRVSHIDKDDHVVRTESGDRITYAKLLLATGGRPRKLTVPGADLSGIFYLRSIADVDQIRRAMKHARRVCIIGGGYIGLEVAAIAVKSDKTVTVLEMEERVLQRVTSKELSGFYHKLHTSHGVDIRTGTAATAFTGEDRIQKVVCNNTELETDLVIVGIGIVPNIELAEDAGLECENGIRVDEHCQTSDPDIYAAGDCTNHPNPILGRRLRLESVPNAMEQAKVAADNMLGGNTTHEAVPWFWSDQYNLKLQMVGFASDGDTHVLRGDQEQNQFAVFHLKDGAVVAVDAINSPRDFMAGRKMYGMKVDPGKLKNPDVNLKSLLS